MTWPWQGLHQGANAVIPVDSFQNAAQITGNDTMDLATIPQQLYIGGAGSVSVNLAGSGSCSFAGVAGGYLKINPSRVFATGTSATGIVGLW